MRALDPARGDKQTYARLDAVLTNAIPLSDPSRIITETGEPATPMFFSEPAHEWCYYFTKAQLAQQQGNFEQVVSLAREAIARKFEPQDQNEWLVFIDGYARVGDFQTAGALSKAALAQDERIRRGVCIAWKQVQAESGEGSESQIEEIMRQIDCNP